MSVAVPEGFDYEAAVRQGSRIRVATKYTTIAREHFADKGVHVDLIKLYGSMELAPLAGLADAIVDLVSTGKTLQANNLVEVEPFMAISSRLVVNQAALKLKREKTSVPSSTPSPASLTPTPPNDRHQAPFQPRRRTSSRGSTRCWLFESAQDESIVPGSAAILAMLKARGDAAVVEYTNRSTGSLFNSVAQLNFAGQLQNALDGLAGDQREALSGGRPRAQLSPAPGSAELAV